MITGRTLRVLRTIKGIKQASLARELGISQQAYSKIEKGAHLSAKRLQDILAAMHCTVQDLELLKQFPGT
jgi:transcriptional regulator with XRE-family HTH domain